LFINYFLQLVHITANWHHISSLSQLSQIIVYILDTLRFWAPFGGLGQRILFICSMASS